MPEQVREQVPEKVKDLQTFLLAIVYLLELVDRASPVLFRRQFRINLARGLEEVITRLKEFSVDEYILNPGGHEEMEQAGLSGNQLALKLESFANSLVRFQNSGGVDNLEPVLDKGAVILGSLVGAIPGFGSFAKELLEFILKEIKKRFKLW